MKAMLVATTAVAILSGLSQVEAAPVQMMGMRCGDLVKDSAATIAVISKLQWGDDVTDPSYYYDPDRLQRQVSRVRAYCAHFPSSTVIQLGHDLFRADE